MYIEIRKNAFYLKNSQWNKETKKTVSTSTYLGSEFAPAKAMLESLVTPESPILEELTKAQELYAYNRALPILSKLGKELGDSKAAKDIAKLVEKMTKAQEKYAEKAQPKSEVKSQLKSDVLSQSESDSQSQKDSDDKSQKENLKKLEDEGQTVLPVCDSQSQTGSDEEAQNKGDNQSQKVSDEEEQGNCDSVPKCPSCKTGYLQEKTGKYGPYLGCTKYPNCRHTENYKSQ
jgi:cobalamin biosynthesis protein CobT